MSEAAQNPVNGMRLSMQYYELCRPLLMQDIPDLMAEAAIGLVGEGSECFGMDDQYSRDHDFGPAFCIWLPRGILAACSSRLEAALLELPREYCGFPSRMASAMGMGRVGPMAVEDFYAFFTGLDHPPSDWREWLQIPEYQLAAATNGEVFEDNNGIFSQWRQILLDFYPRDVWLKKIAARVMAMAQAGQYNLPRVLKRGDVAAAFLAAARFSEAALGFVYLLNRKYMPFYKWAPKMAASLPILGADVSGLLCGLATHVAEKDGRAACAMVEDFCSICAARLRASGLSHEPDSWLWAHGPQIMSHVKNRQILEMDLLKD